MTEMTRRERLLAVSKRQATDRLPFFHNWRHTQTGWAERECRNRGMALSWARPPYVVKMNGVEVVEEQKSVSGEKLFRRTYKTPVGAVSEVEKRYPGTGLWHGQRSWKDVTPWKTEHLIKGPEDYAVVKYIVQNTEYEDDYFPIEQAIDWLGDDGLVVDELPHCPLQMLIVHWVGTSEGRFYFHHYDYPELVDDLYQAVCESREQLYQIVAKSPAPVAWCGDNIDSMIVNPNLYEKYCLPVYERQSEVFHPAGKLIAVHMDGRLRQLKDLIAKTPIDIVEAFHPEPMGDLSLAESLQAWPDKSFWIGFPSSIYELGPDSVRAFALDLLKQAGDGSRVAITMSTENLVSNQNMIALASVLENIELPLSSNAIKAIANSK